eukprot:503688_1
MAVITCFKRVMYIFSTLLLLWVAIQVNIVSIMQFVQTRQQSNIEIFDFKEYSDDIYIFYHIWTTKNKTNEAKLIINEQMQTINESASKSNLSFHIRYLSIGFPIVINHTRYAAINSIENIQYLSSGYEVETLHQLHIFCLANPKKSVIYIHGKGTFHSKKENTLLRRMMMFALFSKNGCLHSSNKTNLPYSCNVCGARFSPVPHHHFPGNFWMAHCSYITQLISPKTFEQEMDEKIKFPLNLSHVKPWRFGFGRFSSEHWVSSHPTMVPCDVYVGSYVHGFRTLPLRLTNKKFNLSLAPRFNREQLFRKQFKFERHEVNFRIDGILYQYNALYATMPPNDSWIWNFYVKE